MPCAPVLVCSLLGVAWSAVRADDPALQAQKKAVEETRAKAEASVVSLWIARGDPYELPARDRPGRLGVFPSGLKEKQAAERSPHLALHHPNFVPEYVASGVVVGAQGLILTCEHAVRGARKILVRLPSRETSYADILAADQRADIAVLQLRRDDLALAPVRLTAKPAPDSVVIAAAHSQVAASHHWVPSTAIDLLSPTRSPPRQALQRSRDQLPLHFTLGTLTTSTRLERPTSGGAVFNLQGEVVGLISIQSELAAIGSLVAINVGPPLNRVVEVLRTGQEVEYGYLGVETVNVTDGEAAVLGFDRAGGVRIVEEPLPGTPAARAGLRRNELILSVDGEWIKNSDELYLRVTLAFAGTSVELETLRDRQRRRVRVKELAKATPLGKPIITNRPASFRGARIDYLTVLLGEITPDQRELQQSLLTGLRQGGVLVREIESGSPADKAGLRLRDIITHVNNLPINGPKEFQRQIAQLTGPIALTLLPLDGQGPPRKLLIP